LTVAAIGCGMRGRIYTGLMADMPDRFTVVAGADPSPQRVEAVRAKADNPDFRGFDSADALLAEDRLADIAIISTQDAYHFEPCKRALEKGYDILLEKPIATSSAEIRELQQLATSLGRRVVVCFVLRYTAFYRKVKEIVDSDALGDIMTINANEGVMPWHQAHSFVRGHWAITGDSSPMIVAKCCHDTDIIGWLIGRQCTHVSSFGKLSHFVAENAPEGAPPRCTDGCPVADTCMYNALKYVDQHRRWLPMVFDNDSTAPDDAVVEWLRTSPWGRCVYRCDNSAVDHQVLAMNFDGGVTGTFTMTAFDNERHVEICGTKGVLRGGGFYKKHLGCDIVVHRFADASDERVQVDAGSTGHGGGDGGLIDALYAQMTGPLEDVQAAFGEAVHAHLLGYAAEQSRLNQGRAIKL
jgi:predicted dehydrogenase